MDIRCPSCSKLFRVADDKIAGKGIRFKCSKCAEIVTITKDDFEMDLLAREADAVEPAPQQQPPEPAARPSPPTSPEPSIKPVLSQPAPSPEPQAREYQPPQEHEIPPAALSDFDFSEPHAAATAAAHSEDGFGGQDFSFNVEPEQDAVPEVEITPEAAAEAEAALQFPDDLISEPTRKPVFGAPSPGELTDEEEPAPKPKAEITQEPSMFQEKIPKTGASVASPGPKPVPEVKAEEEMDLGAAAALAMPKGPVISPELLAQMKRNAPGKSAVQAKAASHTDDDIDLGAALAMPKTPEAAGRKESEADSNAAAASRGAEATSTGKRALVIGLIALVLVAVLASLYYLGFLWGKNEQEALQKPQPTSPPARQVITADGLSIVDPVAFVDKERGDLVITGKIQNTTDKPKPGWYLVTEVRDVKEEVLATARMVNGIQIYSKAELETLAKRGGKIEDLQKKMSSLGEGTIPPKGNIPFEVRVMNPPAGSARFLPMLQSFDPSSVLESLKAGQ
jgi:predicted Zn finger-like uncharacterized protein